MFFAPVVFFKATDMAEDQPLETLLNTSMLGIVCASHEVLFWVSLIESN